CRSRGPQPSRGAGLSRTFAARGVLCPGWQPDRTELPEWTHGAAASRPWLVDDRPVAPGPLVQRRRTRHRCRRFKRRWSDMEGVDLPRRLLHGAQHIAAQRLLSELRPLGLVRPARDRLLLGVVLQRRPAE